MVSATYPPDASSAAIGGLGTAKAAKTLPNDDDNDGDASAQRGIAPPLRKNRTDIPPPCSGRLIWASIVYWEGSTIHVPFLRYTQVKGGPPLVHVVVVMVHMNIACCCRGLGNRIGVDGGGGAG